MGSYLKETREPVVPEVVVQRPDRHSCALADDSDSKVLLAAFVEEFDGRLHHPVDGLDASDSASRRIGHAQSVGKIEPGKRIVRA
jgi:hypothetical protein